MDETTEGKTLWWNLQPGTGVVALGVWTVAGAVTLSLESEWYFKAPFVVVAVLLGWAELRAIRAERNRHAEAMSIAATKANEAAAMNITIFKGLMQQFAEQQAHSEGTRELLLKQMGEMIVRMTTLLRTPPNDPARPKIAEAVTQSMAQVNTTLGVMFTGGSLHPDAYTTQPGIIRVPPDGPFQFPAGLPPGMKPPEK